MSDKLTPERALIFRIVHLDNIAGLLRDGLWCSSSRPSTAAYTQVGNLDLIERRKSRAVPCDPFGLLPDYVPFYFTPFTPMLLNIKTGYNGVKREPMDKIVILATSLHHLPRHGIRFVFSDRHAYLALARFSSDLADLAWIDWTSLQSQNFRKDNRERFERYQAEALVYRHLPISALVAVICYDECVKQAVESLAASVGVAARVVVRREWYL